ncbi:uncharacterized protein LOC121235373 [Juglans microcarpa x Juglans regia]|uniref:uncharacterized protein LOC121235373 n=1 Tax=Juglans microcarpa x Juglans regia TaxID=2249226 RepID=UPI001B7EF8BF|nr:uncharacterized protein LOC121235373 [Juglans microcarpa x Juglans regia]
MNHRIAALQIARIISLLPIPSSTSFFNSENHMDHMSSSDSDEVEILMSRNCPQVKNECIDAEIVEEQCDVNVRDGLDVGDGVNMEDHVDKVNLEDRVNVGDGDGVNVEDGDEVIVISNQQKKMRCSIYKIEGHAKNKCHSMMYSTY